MPVEAVFFNVGQGDCTFLWFYKNVKQQKVGTHAVLIDCGSSQAIAPWRLLPGQQPSQPRTEMIDRLTHKLDDYLGRMQNPNVLDHLIITHPDKDHFNLLEEVLLRNKNKKAVSGATTVSGSTDLQALTVNKDLDAKAAFSVTKAVTMHGTLTVDGLLTGNSDITVSYGGTTKFTTSGQTGIAAAGISVDGKSFIFNGTSIRLENSQNPGGYLWAYGGKDDDKVTVHGEVNNARSYWTVHGG
ncbi:MBL fold metallo-hydrolase [Streptomyces sp. VNUA116]|uniref:MBL fold metallo-hydrolase n=1 Tax=Streptomyces sp. VNUA116 TaxID=3062449 RepID=UPI002675B72E|nr:MBL fold metallo-hydrolase [Streptomyces sp. VNUA116]WKU48720.1 MBL fold metallo-hydrolase [Streptomyces sp. VNUA116]